MLTIISSIISPSPAASFHPHHQQHHILSSPSSSASSHHQQHHNSSSPSSISNSIILSLSSSSSLPRISSTITNSLLILPHSRDPIWSLKFKLQRQPQLLPFAKERKRKKRTHCEHNFFVFQLKIQTRWKYSSTSRYYLWNTMIICNF